MNMTVRYGVLAATLYVVFLIVLLPADRVYAVLKDKVSLPVSLYQIDGSVWEGRASVAVIGTQRLESFVWQLKPLALFMGRLQIALGASKNNGRLSTVMGRSVTGDYFLRDVNADLPATELESLFSPVKLGLSGSVIANMQEIQIEGNQLSVVEGRLIWNNAGLSPSAANSAGSFEINFETTAEGIKGVLKDTGGPLQADGILLLKPDNSYQLSASFTPRDAQRNDIRQALRFLGNPDASGKVTVSQSGKFQLEKYLPIFTSS